MARGPTAENKFMWESELCGHGSVGPFAMMRKSSRDCIFAVDLGTN